MSRLPPTLGARHPAAWLATWGFSGLSPVAPGTMGSLAALPVAALIVWLGGHSALLAGIGVVSVLGWWASAVYAARLGDKDPGAVVIDEVAGMWIALLAVPFEPLWWGAAFVVFRLLDIAKPWPVSWADRSLSGGLGIMADDLIAGALAAGLLFLAGLALT